MMVVIFETCFQHCHFDAHHKSFTKNDSFANAFRDLVGFVKLSLDFSHN